MDAYGNYLSGWYDMKKPRTFKCRAIWNTASLPVLEPGKPILAQSAQTPDQNRH